MQDKRIDSLLEIRLDKLLRHHLRQMDKLHLLRDQFFLQFHLYESILALQLKRPLYFLLSILLSPASKTITVSPF